MRYGLNNTTKVILLIWSPEAVASVVGFENVKVMSISEIYRLWSIAILAIREMFSSCCCSTQMAYRRFKPKHTLSYNCVNIHVKYVIVPQFLKCYFARLHLSQNG